MTEKIMIVDASYSGTKITTVDGNKRNAIRQYDVDVYSFSELARRIFYRFEDDKFDRIIVDANGVGMGVIDQIKALFDKKGYYFSAEKGTVDKKGIIFSKEGMKIVGDAKIIDYNKSPDTF